MMCTPYSFTTAPLALILSLALAAPALASPFAQIGGSHPARDAPAIATTVVSLPIAPTEARRRLDAYMTAQGFEPADAERSPTAVSYVRFDERTQFHTLADCHGPVVGAPIFWLETLVVDLEPEASGVRMTTTGQFQIVLKGLVSGSPFKVACRSLGGLEAKVRDAVSSN